MKHFPLSNRLHIRRSEKMAIKTQYTDDYCEYMVNTHGRSIYKIIYLYVKNKADAEDIFQQVFLTLVEKKPKLKDKNHEIGWLIRVAQNKSKDFLKSYWKKNIQELREEEYLLDNEENQDMGVLDSIFGLDKKYRTVIYMYYYEGYASGEIADILGIKDATIRTQLKRGREELARLLKESGIYEG